MEIINTKIYGLEESVKKSGYAMRMGTPPDMSTEVPLSEKDFKRAIRLGKVPTGTAHDNFLKGIIVQGDLRYTQYTTKQIQRYHFIDYVSSQSMMHTIHKVEDVKKYSNKYVLEETAEIVNNLIKIFNINKFPHTLDSGTVINTKKDCFMFITSNVPMGYMLWTGFSTNYLQLKTMYKQRVSVTHKLEDWKSFGEWCDSLPMFKELTGIK